MQSPRLLAIGSFVLLVLASNTAHATLTDSEKAQVVDFYRNGDAAGAAKVRALLARPDVTPEEATEVFGRATRGKAFDAKEEKFVSQLLFGPASNASRSEIVVPVVRGLLERAEEVCGASGAGPSRATEVARIHAFVAGQVASRDDDAAPDKAGAASIRTDALRTIVEAYKRHLSLPALDPARMNGPMQQARLQAEIALVRVSKGVTPTAEIAAALGNDPQKRALLTQTSILVHGTEGAPPARSEAVTQMLMGFPQATATATLLWIGKPWPTVVRSKHGLLVAQADLAHPRELTSGGLWSSSVEPALTDPAVAETAFVISRAGAAHLLQSDANFRDAAVATRGRAFAAKEPELLAVGAAEGRLIERDRDVVTETMLLSRTAQLLLLDAPRALSLALAQSTIKRYAPLEQFALGLGLIAADAQGTLRPTVQLGKPRADGGLSKATFTQVEGPPGRVTAFTFEGKRYALKRAPDGSVLGVTANGAAPALKSIPFARTPTSAGPDWKLSGLTFAAASGSPQMGSDGPKVIVRGDTREGAVVLRTGVPEIRFIGTVEHAPNGSAIILRAESLSPKVRTKSPGRMSGIVLSFVGTEAAKSASIVAIDPTGKPLPLAPAIPLAKTSNGYALDVTLLRDRLELTIDGKSVKLALSGAMIAPAHVTDSLGDVGLVAPADADLVFRTISVKKAP